MATVSLVQQPQPLEPINAPLWYVLTSDVVDRGFKYVYRIYSYDRFDNTSNYLGEYKVPPRPKTFEGIFDPHNILKSRIGPYDFPLDIRGVYGVEDDQCIVKYKATYGYEHNTEIKFSDTFTYSSTLYSYPALALTFTFSNTIQVNDIINIKVDNLTNTVYNGVAIVSDKIGNNVYTDIRYNTTLKNALGITQSETGIVNSIQRITGSASQTFAFNGTRQYTERERNYSQYDISTFTASFATNYVGDKEIFLNQYETISFMCLNTGNPLHLSNTNIIVRTYNTSKVRLDQYISTVPIGITNSFIKYELGVGTKNLQGWTMSAIPVHIPQSGYYSAQLLNAGVIDVTCWRKIVNNCSPYENVRIMFMNRLGGYDYWNFNYDTKYSLDINRTTFNKQLSWDYNIGDRGKTVLTVDANEVYMINSDWLSESDYLFLQELVTSPDVFVIDEVNNQKIPIIIKDTRWEQKTALREKQFYLTITYMKSFDLNLQGG